MTLPPLEAFYWFCAGVWQTVRVLMRENNKDHCQAGLLQPGHDEVITM